MMEGMFLSSLFLVARVLSSVICRFADEELSEEETLPHLSQLIRTYLSTMADLGAETWIMHGTLLAWWWNQKVA